MWLRRKSSTISHYVSSLNIHHRIQPLPSCTSFSTLPSSSRWVPHGRNVISLIPFLLLGEFQATLAIPYPQFERSDAEGNRKKYLPKIRPKVALENFPPNSFEERPTPGDECGPFKLGMGRTRGRRAVRLWVERQGGDEHAERGLLRHALLARPWADSRWAKFWDCFGAGIHTTSGRFFGAHSYLIDFKNM